MDARGSQAWRRLHDQWSNHVCRLRRMGDAAMAVCGMVEAWNGARNDSEARAGTGKAHPRAAVLACSAAVGACAGEEARAEGFRFARAIAVDVGLMSLCCCDGLGYKILSEDRHAHTKFQCLCFHRHACDGGVERKH